MAVNIIYKSRYEKIYCIYTDSFVVDRTFLSSHTNESSESFFKRIYCSKQRISYIGKCFVIRVYIVYDMSIISFVSECCYDGDIFNNIAAI